MRRIRKRIKKQTLFLDSKGFTILEVILAVVIALVVLGFLLQLYLYWLTISEIAANFSYAASGTQAKLEEMRNRAFYNYGSIPIDYGPGGSPGNIFSLSHVNAKGVIYVDTTNPKLLDIEIVTSFLSDKKRVVGEDLDLDGVLDLGEDANNNGKFDSPVGLHSYIAKR